MVDPCRNCPHDRDESGLCLIDGNCSKREDYLEWYREKNPPQGVFLDPKVYGWWDNPDHPTRWEKDHEDRPRTI